MRIQVWSISLPWSSLWPQARLQGKRVTDGQLTWVSLKEMNIILKQVAYALFHSTTSVVILLSIKFENCFKKWYKEARPLTITTMLPQPWPFFDILCFLCKYVSVYCSFRSTFTSFHLSHWPVPFFIRSLLSISLFMLILLLLYSLFLFLLFLLFSQKHITLKKMQSFNFGGYFFQPFLSLYAWHHLTCFQTWHYFQPFFSFFNPIPFLAHHLIHPGASFRLIQF